MSTIFYILVYGLIGLPVCFVTLVLARLFDFQEDNKNISAVLSLIIWPAAIVVQLISLIFVFLIVPFITKLDEWAKALANKLS